MSSPTPPDVTSPIGSFEYELTDDLAVQSTEAMFAWQARQVKAALVTQGALHPAVPLVLSMAFLVIGIAAVLLLGGDGLFIQVLIVSSVLLLFYLAFKWALYFYPPFTRWYLRRLALRGIRTLNPRTIRWSIYDDRFDTQSAAIQRSLPWRNLRAIQIAGDFWFFHMQGADAPLLVPARELTSELQTFIRRKAVEVGAMVEEEPAAGQGSAAGGGDMPT